MRVSGAVGTVGLVFLSSVSLALIGCGSTHAPDGGGPVDLAALAGADLSGLPGVDMAVAPGVDMAAPAGVQTVTVHVAPNGALLFSPAAVTIRTGDTVHWVFDAVGHNVTSGVVPTPDGRFCSMPGPNGDCVNGRATIYSNIGQVYDHVFAEAGNFPYYCGVHLFAGTVTVQQRM
jgi:plastocyanin